MASLTSVIEKKSQRHICQLCASSWTILFPFISTILAFGPYISSLIWICKPEIMKKSGWIWSTAKHFMKKSGKKIALIGQKIALIGQKMPKLKLFRFFMFFFAVQILNFHIFCEFRPCLNSIPIAMSQNHLWMRSYSLGMGASQIYSAISSPYSCFVVLTLLICREVAGYCWTLWESFIWDFSIVHPLIHAIQDVQFISIPLNQHFLLKVPRAIFLARAKNIGSGLKIQPESIQTIIMAWGIS